MTKDEALKLALEALKRATNYDPVIARAITAIKEALSSEATGMSGTDGAQPAQEPVAWATRMGEYAHIHWGAKQPEYPMVYEVPLYKSPPASKPLTDEEIDSLYETTESVNWGRNFARAIEAAHGIKEEA